MLFKDDSVSGVGLVNGIRDIADEGNQADYEVDDHIDQHHHAQSRRESAIDLLAFSHNHQGKRGVSSVSDAVEGILLVSGIFGSERASRLTMEQCQSRYPSQSGLRIG
jgi:hypothetical protein